MKKATRADVAAKAGVSQTIVSYVLNNNRYVEQNKRERVLKAVEELGYKPSPLSRALKGKGADHYLFIADDLMSEHFAIIINELETLVKKDGVCISLCSDRNDTSLLSWHFDGIIIASAQMEEKRINEYINLNSPTVVLAMKDYTLLQGSFGIINSGLKQGSKEAVLSLINKGRKKILFIPSLNLSSFENDYRYLGYKEAMKENNLPLQVMDSVKDEDELKENLKNYDFDAVFARTDTVAAIAMQAIKEKRKTIPDEVSVIGVNNTSLSRYTTPTLTTIDIDRKAIAESIIALFKRLKEEKNPSILLKTKLIERESV